VRRELSDNVTWIGDTYPVRGELHVHVSVFLVETPDGYVLIDTGSHYFEETIVTEVSEAAGDADLDAVLVSHADLPHTGNIDSLRDRLGDFELYSATSAPELVGIPSPIECHPGETMSIAGHEFSFTDGPLADITDTVWVYDHGDGTLFSADGFGSYHRPEDRAKLSSEFPDGVPTEYIFEYHYRMFRWLKYVDCSRLIVAIDDLFDEFEIDYIAPTHGTPVVETGVDQYRTRFERSIEDAIAIKSDSHSVTAIRGIGPIYAGELAETGIESVSDLLAANAVRVATESSLPETRVRTWKIRANKFEKL
jgi:flavorubredoxin